VEKEKLLEEIQKINYIRKCECGKTKINCLDGKEWLVSQLGVWKFTYETRDMRNKNLHPATFPIALAKKVISLFSHEGELILDPFVGSGTTLIAARDLSRNAIGVDIKKEYIELCYERLNKEPENESCQYAIEEDSINVRKIIGNEKIALVFTSPPYANLLNRPRKNKSRRERNNEQLDKIEQYSQNERDLGTMEIERYSVAMKEVFSEMYLLLKPKGHCVMN